MSTPLLELRQITCRFPGGIVANEDIDLTIQPGSVHALLGENGAGKSTLMKIAFGMQQPTSGSLHWRGAPVRFRSASDAKKVGIGMVHQHFMLIPTLRVWENMFLGQEPRRGLQLDRHNACDTIRTLSRRYGIEVEPEARVETLSVGQQQRVEILKALIQDISLLILDEPTAVLTPQEIDTLFESLRQLVKDGMTILFISHKLREVRALADQVTILRRGKKVDEGPIEEMDDQRITKAMVGRLPKIPKASKDPSSRLLLQAKDIHLLDHHKRPAIQGLNFSLHEGEVLGIAGVEGNGQHELIEALAGLRPLQQGYLHLTPHTKATTTKEPAQHVPLALETLSTAQRLAQWMAYVPEDRQKHGLVMEHTVEENMLLGRQHEDDFLQHKIWLNKPNIRRFVLGQIEHFALSPPTPTQRVQSLSGGNQQKVLIARESTRQAHLYVIAHPTRGVDVGAIEVIHETLLRLRDQGAGILLFSSELPELLTLSDRIMVLYNGQNMGIVQASQTDEDQLGERMLGLHQQSPANHPT